jgi:AP endonuclease-1
MFFVQKNAKIPKIPIFPGSNSEVPQKKRKLEDTPSKVDSNSSPNNHSTTDSNLEVKAWNWKISSFNIAGLRAWVKKDGLKYLQDEQPDILCLQELKCADEDLPAECRNPSGYHSYWHGMKQHSGVGLLTKSKPISVKYGFGSKFDAECRSITAEFEKFILVNAYVPNAGRGLKTLDKRLEWNVEFHKYLSDLDKKKPVILTGDLNVAHQEIGRLIL